MELFGNQGIININNWVTIYIEKFFVGHLMSVLVCKWRMGQEAAICGEFVEYVMP